MLERATKQWEQEGKLGWRDLEARPFLRFKHTVAEAYEYAGKLNQALEHYQAILSADEGDPLGVRFRILSIYARTLQWQKAEELANAYKDGDHHWDDQIIVPLLVAAIVTDREVAARSLMEDLITVNLNLSTLLTSEDPYAMIIDLSSPKMYRSNSIESLAIAFSHLLPIMVHSVYVLGWMWDTYEEPSGESLEVVESQPEHSDYGSHETMPENMYFFILRKNLPYQGYKALWEAGLVTSKAIEAKGAKALKQLKGVGPATVQALKDLGLNI